MEKHILFIQGGGDDGYKEDEKLVTSLRTLLEASYQVQYPRMPSDESLPDFGWLHKIENEITAIKGQTILVGHSLGGSMLLKYLSEKDTQQEIAGIFLIATPFWSGDEDWIKGLKLPAGFSDKLPKNTPVFLYHCRDDQEVPFEHLARYAQHLPNAIIRELASGGHQLNNDLSIVANDIRSL
ncbi:MULTISPECIES: alpha/beta fold hydrolase [Niastella]|uniref:Serine hydrolase family protein n=1 Tax=Niastella soli TaxID=2821487 RepID=A0ABS3Z718_9BACT|nr:alpha/beta fold hydrolase [Niastella soli]MBO9205480.1 serine hydrolase family protein [Niastella soli]